MRQWLLKQRQKPKHVRDNIAFGVASLTTVLVFVGWIVLIPNGDVFNGVAADPAPEAFSTFFDQVKEQVAGVRESVKEQASTSAPVSTTTGFGTYVAPTSSQAISSTSSTQPKEAVIYIVPSASTTTSTPTPAW